MSTADFLQLLEPILKYGITAVLCLALGLWLVKKAAAYFLGIVADSVTKVLRTCDRADEAFAELIRRHDEFELRVQSSREQAIKDAADVFNALCSPERCEKILGIETNIRDLRHCYEALAKEVHVCKMTIQEFCREGRESREVTLKAIYEIKDAVLVFIREYARELIETIKALRNRGVSHDN